MHELYTSIASKVRVIIERQSQLVEAIQESRTECERLRLENERLQTEVGQLKADLECMAVARTLGSRPQHLSDSRAVIS